MTGHGEKQTRKQEDAIVALLSQPTVEAAASECGISPKTLYRWLRDPAFKAQYRTARSAVLESAIATMQQITSEAVDTLKRNLNAEQATAQISAAKLIIDNAFRGQELIDLGDRVERLEEFLVEVKQGKKQ